MKTKCINKTNGAAGNMAIVGSGAGLTLYVIYGVLNASFIGGLIGLNIAGAVLGTPVESTVLSKAIVALSMLGGVMVGGLVFTLGGATLGWLAGLAVDFLRGAVHHGDAHHAGAKH